MKYRIEITDESGRLTGVLLLEFRDDVAATQFADKIARKATDQWIEVWDGDRSVTVLPVRGSDDKALAAN